MRKGYKMRRKDGNDVYKEHLIGHLHYDIILLLSPARILHGFAFLCKLGFLLFRPHWNYKI